MPTDEELDAMAQATFCKEWNGLAEGQRIAVMYLAIAAKHAKAACDLAEDSANYMRRIVL